MNAERPAIRDSPGRPINLFLTAGQVRDDNGARALPGRVPKVDWRPADRRCQRSE